MGYVKRGVIGWVYPEIRTVNHGTCELRKHDFVPRVQHERLDGWLRKDLTSRFGERILPVDLEIADACGRLVARSESLGHPMEPRDAFIAATSEVHGLTLVTRNASDFEGNSEDYCDAVEIEP
jgi:hypothetical protein